MSKGFVWDIESSDLLDESTIDYTKSPYVLKPSFILHCIVVVDKDTKNVTAFYDGNNIIFDGREHKITAGNFKYTLKNYTPQKYTRKYLKDFPGWVKENAENSTVIAHNQINFDLLTCKLYYGMPYTVEEDTWCGMPVEFVDTLVLSKALNPDRFGGHSLDNLSSKTGVRKIEFRKDMPADERFKYFGADMLYYNIYDCLSNLEVYNMLNKEAEGWDWSDAISLEKSVAEIITRQSHRGFLFDKDLAEMSIKELDSLMQERRERVEPLLPPKEATQAFKKEYTPPKNQFKKDGSLSSNILKWVEKHGGEFVNENTQVSIFGKIYDLPLPQTPLIESVPATIDDSTHIKGWLVSLGWEPSEWKEKDITIDTKKQKLSNDKFKQTVERYVDQTLKSPFCQHRCEYLKTTPEMLKNFLLSANTQKPVRVLTNPNFTVGQEKELCRDLERISETFPYVKDVVEYLTYKHRRNSILGGGVDWEDEEDAEKGYLASVRADGRIPTPADTCGAATSRMKHKLVANIPRITSLYGKNMRGLFGVDKAGYYQIGYDFDSLEAREEAHYCYRYESEPREYCNSLLMEKPHDVHSMMAKKISSIIGREFSRTPAKSVKYAGTYGAQAKKIAKTIGEDVHTGEIIFNAFWEAAKPLSDLKDRLKLYWEKQGKKKFILGIDGRKVPTRSAHAILNSLFQSAGVICAKRAMVIHDRLLKQHGVSVDFFMEDWRNKTFAQQIIAYHDEAQLEVSKSLVQFKMFASEDAAKEFKRNETKVWSDIKYSDKLQKWYVAYSLVGELAARSVKEAGEYYNLNVDLTAGYVVGQSWADCH